MRCKVCKFDNEPLPGEPSPTHCGGCGTRLQGGDKPFPGRRVDPERRNDPWVLDDDDRQRLRERFEYVDDEDIENLLVVKEATYHWGNGLGEAPDGYIIERLVTVDRDREPCEKCGCTVHETTTSNDHAGIAGAEEVVCTTCEHVIEYEHWC